MTIVDLTTQDAAVIGLWEKVAELVSELPAGWVLVGGLMVQLHAIRAGASEIRATTDIDILCQARPPGALPKLADALIEAGFELGEPDLDGYSHRFIGNDTLVDLLAPDGVNKRIDILGNASTVGIPGGAQALKRAEGVHLKTPDTTFGLQVPTLLGATLIKARSVRVHRDPDAQLQDLAALLTLFEDPAEAAVGLSGSERSWLRKVKPRLDNPDPTVVAPETAQQARLVLAVLLA